LLQSIFYRILKKPVLTWRLWGKASVPDEVNDHVAHQGSVGQKIYLRKNVFECAKIFLEKKKKM
jgi:hypothetical protein